MSEFTLEKSLKDGRRASISDIQISSVFAGQVDKSSLFFFLNGSMCPITNTRLLARTMPSVLTLVNTARFQL